MARQALTSHLPSPIVNMNHPWARSNHTQFHQFRYFQILRLATHSAIHYYLSSILRHNAILEDNLLLLEKEVYYDKSHFVATTFYTE